MTSKLRVVIAEDHYLVREGTRRTLEDADDIEVVAVVGTATELEDVVPFAKPDVIVTDIRMPPGHQTDGIDAALRIRASNRHVGVVVLSQYADATYALELLSDGTEGLAYLLKERVGNPAQLIDAVRQVANGGSVIDRDVVAALVEQNTSRSPSRLQQLTEHPSSRCSSRWHKAEPMQESPNSYICQSHRSRNTPHPYSSSSA